MDDRTDEDLLRAYARGDRRAFHALFERYAARLKAYALRTVRNPGQADDVVAEAFGRVAAAPDQWAGRGSVRAWLFTIAHRLCVDELRERRRDGEIRARGASAASAVAWPPSPEAQAMLGQLAVRLEAAVARLPEAHRQVLMLRVMHGLTSEETAQVVGLDELQVRSQLSYARKQLRGILEGGEDAAPQPRPARKGG